MVTGCVPGLVSVTVLAALVVKTTWLPKLSSFGVLISGPASLPASVNVSVLGGAVVLSPGPEMLTKLLPVGDPVTATSAAPSPMKPAGAVAGLAGSRKFLAILLPSARLKSHAGGVAPHPTSSRVGVLVGNSVPSASVVYVLTPYGCVMV